MILGTVILLHSRSNLCIIHSGTVTAWKYRNDILDPFVTLVSISILTPWNQNVRL